MAVSKSQAKLPAPPSWDQPFTKQVGQAFSLPDFCHGLAVVFAMAVGRAVAQADPVRETYGSQ
jgi:hypothetical protein